MAEYIRVTPLDPSQRVNQPPLNAKAFEKYFDKIGLDKDDMSLPGWLSVGDLFTNIAKEKNLVQEWDQLMLRDVPQKFKSIAAVLLVKCFGNCNVTVLPTLYWRPLFVLLPIFLWFVRFVRTSWRTSFT